MTDAHHQFTSSLGQLLAEMERLRSSATEALIESMDAFVPPSLDDLTPEVEELAELLRSIRVAMLKDPIGARAFVSFLAEEGRRYAESDAGRMWREALLASPYLDHLRDLWDAVSLDIFDHVAEEGPIPTAWVDMLTDALANREDIEALLDALRPRGFQ